MGAVTTNALLLLAVWDLLLLGRVSSRWVGSEAATFISFLLAALLVTASRRRRALERARSALGIAVGTVAGWATYPMWVFLIVSLGLALGLPPREGLDRPAQGIASILSAVVLAPVFEELLYRERLLVALRARAGASVAIAVTSVLFALPHLEAWSVLGTFLVGLALGVTRVVAGSISLCIGIHAGLNLASVAWARG
jgi:membrane protease YdiL (CAAX protease family)